MDADDLLDLLESWLESQPIARGHGVEDAELRLRTSGKGRIVVWLGTKNPEAEFRAVGKFLIETLLEARAQDRGETVERPTPMNWKGLVIH